MKPKNAGWILIGIAVVVGVLRLLDVIDNSITAVFIVLAFIMVTGALAGARKKRDEEKEPEVVASQKSDEEL